jgi:flagella basal body P-ring formation protein FlgA
MVKKHPQQILFLSCLLIAVISCLLILGLPSWSWASSWEPQTVIKKYLKDHYPWAEIEILDISAEAYSSQEPPIKIYLLRGPLGKAVFSFVFKSGEKALVQAQIRALDWVVTSRRPLSRLQVIQKEDIYLALMDVRVMPKDALTRLETAWGKTVSRSVGANMPIIDNTLGDVPLIKKGQRITLVASAPGFKITTIGEARQDGLPGQQIKVVNLSSKRDIRGIPLDENNVRVEF